MHRTSLATAALLLVFAATATAQSAWNQAYQDYIDKYKDLAIEQMLHHNIPASITLAQGLLESAAGRSELAVKGNNHFGIKCHNWTGKTIHHDDDERQECFRRYDNPQQSYEDHSAFLTQSQRYARLFLLPRDDYKAWAKGLKAAGYATSPTYAQTLIRLVETYNLAQYDKAKTYDKFIANHQAADITHVIKCCNKNYYVIARRGDTFQSIGKETGVSWKKLAKYNERDKKDSLDEGDIIFLKKKRSKADKSFKNNPHTVRAGESLYSIAQKYAITLKSLYKKNNLTADYDIRPGDILRVY